MDRISFEKPDIPVLNSRGFACIDMHVHSIYSDTFTTVNRILKKCRKDNFGVALTDHNEIKGSVKAFQFREVKNKEILIVPGMEVSSSEGPHLLIYFYYMSDLTDFFEKVIKNKRNKNPYTAIKLSMQEIIDKSGEYSCLKSAAHPFNLAHLNFEYFIKKQSSPEIMKGIDAVEVISSLCLRKMNNKAVGFCDEYKKAITAGSDAHSISDVGKAITCSKSDSVENFLDSIKARKNFVVGKETTNRARVYTYSKSIVRHMRHPVNTVNIRVKSRASRIKRAILKIRKQQ